MIPRGSTLDMHHMLDSLSAIRETAPGWMGANSRLGFAGIDRAFLRSIKFAPPGAYRMPVRRPNPPAEELERAAQCDWRTARASLLSPLGIGFVESRIRRVHARAEFGQVLSARGPQHSPHDLPYGNQDCQHDESAYKYVAEN